MRNTLPRRQVALEQSDWVTPEASAKMQSMQIQAPLPSILQKPEHDMNRKQTLSNKSTNTATDSMLFPIMTTLTRLSSLRAGCSTSHPRNLQETTMQ